MFVRVGKLTPEVRDGAVDDEGPGVGGRRRPGRAGPSRRVEGITFTDSQNLCGDPFVAVALAAAATDTLSFATRVTNAHTRLPRRSPPSRRRCRRPRAGASCSASAGATPRFPSRPAADAGADSPSSSPIWRPTSPAARSTRRAPQPVPMARSCERNPRFRSTSPGRAPADRVLARSANGSRWVGADPDRVSWAMDVTSSAAADAGRYANVTSRSACT